MDEFIDKLIAFREEKKMLESKLKEAEAKYEDMKNAACYNEEKFTKCKREKQILEKECKKLSADYLRLRNDYNAIIANNSTVSKELSNLLLVKAKLEEEISKLREESNRRFLSHSERDIKAIAVRELVEQLIIYAERENKIAAREIRFALDKNMANGYIPSEALTPEFKQRLDNLGRENQIIVHNTNYNYSSGSNHLDYRRTLNLERKENDGKIIDKL